MPPALGRSAHIARGLCTNEFTAAHERTQASAGPESARTISAEHARTRAPRPAEPIDQGASTSAQVPHERTAPAHERTEEDHEPRHAHDATNPERGGGTKAWLFGRAHPARRPAGGPDGPASRGTNPSSPAARRPAGEAPLDAPAPAARRSGSTGARTLGTHERTHRHPPPPKAPTPAPPTGASRGCTNDLPGPAFPVALGFDSPALWAAAGQPAAASARAVPSRRSSPGSG
jgi:hypothetical protein